MNDKIPVTCYVCFYNEDKWIDETLEAVSCCEQIIFLDDSEDGHGREYADKYDCEYYKWEGEDSMSERRNYAIGFRGNKKHKPNYLSAEWFDKKEMPKVKHEWILQLDADELYGDNLGQELKVFVKSISKECNTGAFKLFNLRKDEESSMGYISIPRLFRKGTVHWTKPIQNNIDFKGAVADIPVIIKHFGYGDPEYQLIKQWKRLPLLEKCVRDNPEDFFSRKYLINVLSILASGPNTWERLYAQCAIATHKFVENKKLHDDKDSCVAMQKIMRFLFIGCQKIGNMFPWMVLAERVWEYISFHPDMWYFAFLIYAHAGNRRKIIECGEMFFKTFNNFNMTPKMIEVTTAGQKPEVAKILQQVYEELAQQTDSQKEEKRFARRAGVWGRMKLETGGV